MAYINFQSNNIYVELINSFYRTLRILHVISFCQILTVNAVEQMKWKIYRNPIDVTYGKHLSSRTTKLERIL